MSYAGTETGDLQEVSAPAAPASASAADEAIVRHLEQLATAQSPVEAQLIADQGSANVLADPETGEILAAEVVEPARRQMVIDAVMIGCPTGAACVYVNGGKSPLGFTGTGHKYSTMNSVTKFYAGNRATTLWNGAVYAAAKSSTTYYFTKAASFTAITRS
jgi:hypothetical protein